MLYEFFRRLEVVVSVSISFALLNLLDSKLYIVKWIRLTDSSCLLLILRPFECAVQDGSVDMNFIFLTLFIERFLRSPRVPLT
jgi:hypothetical protein